MKNLRNEFPALSNYTYLNTAAAGLLPQSVYAYKQADLQAFLATGSLFRDEKSALLAQVREALAAFFQTEAARIALVSNFSFGFNALLEGLPKPQKVLLLAEDYPSINWPVTSRMFDTVQLPVTADLESAIYQAVEQHQPDVFAFSLVQYISGLKINMDFIKQLKTDFPELLIIGDGTQFCGTEAFDFDDSGLDILGASAYKWMNAGFGNAFFLFKPMVSERIFPKNKGFGSTIGKYKQADNTFIGNLEPGHLDTAEVGSLLPAITLQQAIGQEQITEQLSRLRTHAYQAFQKRNLLDNHILNRKEAHSTLFNISGDDALFQRLQDAQIICSQRGSGIRVSFHYYNSLADIDKLLQVIDD